MNNKLTNALWGLVLIAVGVIFGLNALEITDIDIFFDGWWTLFIIIPCGIDIFKSGNNKGFDIAGLIVGIALLLACQDIVDFEMIAKLIVPVILVLIGLSIIFKDVIGDKVRGNIKKIGRSDKEYCATFSEQNIDFAGDVFEGCNLSAIFGSVNCNLKNSIVNSDCAVHALALFGGMTIHVPDNVNVKITSTPIFGGVSDKRTQKVIDAPYTVYINASCIFGGIDIK